jgi:hypothetical protein
MLSPKEYTDETLLFQLSELVRFVDSYEGGEPTQISDLAESSEEGCRFVVTHAMKVCSEVHRRFPDLVTLMRSEKKLLILLSCIQGEVTNSREISDAQTYWVPTKSSEIRLIAETRRDEGRNLEWSFRPTPLWAPVSRRLSARSRIITGVSSD